MKLLKRPKRFEDGGPVKDDDKDKPVIQPDPDKLASAQDSMRKAFGYERGGQVGVHDPIGANTTGKSKAGAHLRSSNYNEFEGNEARYASEKLNAVKEHHKIIDEGRSIQPKLQGLAEGGEVKEDSYDHLADDENIQDMMGEELMSAIHSKDYKKIMQGMEAMILSCMNKKDNENA